MTDNRDISFLEDFYRRLNSLGKNRVPFVFVIDYKQYSPLLWTIDEIDARKVSFNFNGFTNEKLSSGPGIVPDFYFHKSPVPFEEYAAKFRYVQDNIFAGNSFLVNLSLPTPVETNLSMREIFQYSRAPYRFLMEDNFVCFSPEIFIKISENHISSYPMKGTIDAALSNAAGLLLSDAKESAEHATIVDLIRNDLSMVAKEVWVERYRYLDHVTTSGSSLLQMSSEVAGILPDHFDRQFGDVLEKLLPAGSVTGAPKPKTLEIIHTAEGYERGYYTGVMGYFDGRNFETAVMIRFIENIDGQLVFKSGGGITASSQVEAEYRELIDKVYLPFASVMQ